MDLEQIDCVFCKKTNSISNLNDERWTLFDCILYSEPDVEIILGQVIRDSVRTIQSELGCNLTEIYTPLESLLCEDDFCEQVHSFNPEQKQIVINWLDFLLEYDAKSGCWDHDGLDRVAKNMRSLLGVLDERI